LVNAVAKLGKKNDASQGYACLFPYHM